MLFFYNWKFLYRRSNANCLLTLRFLRELHSGKLTDKILSTLNGYNNKRKYNYIKDILGLLGDKSATPTDKCTYLYCASKRNYADYIENNRDWLYSFELDFDINILKANKLLRIEGNKIYFKY